MALPERSDIRLPICDRCEALAPPPLSATFVVLAVGGKWSLDGPAVVERLRAGQLAGTDWIVRDDGSKVLVAEHPTFAPLYASGDVGEVVVPVQVAAKGAARLPGRYVAAAGRVLVGVTLGGVLATAGGWAYLHRDELLARVEAEALPVLAPSAADPGAAKEGPAVVTPVAVAGPGPVDQLVARVGPVEEPRALLVAQAWQEWEKGGRAAALAAVALAERAVARAPNDPEALGLLASLLVETGGDASTVRALADRCLSRHPDADGCARARAAVAVAESRLDDARAAVQACAGRGDLACRAVYVTAVARDAARPLEALGAVQKLSEVWPSNRELSRSIALLSSQLDVPEARSRVESARRDIKGDPDLEAAYAGLIILDGETRAGLSLALELGESCPPWLRVRAGAVAVAGNEPERAISLVGGVGDDPGVTDDVRRSARLVLAQARYMEAARDPTKIEAAKAAVASLVELGRTDPVVAQVRARVAMLSADGAETARAWASMDNNLRTGAELSRVIATQVALGIAAKQPVSDLVPLAEQARRADLSAPEGHLWLARAHLEGHNPAQAIDVLLGAILQVDGQAARRRAGMAALAPGVPAKEVKAMLETGVGNDATFARAYQIALATTSWLGDDSAAALRALDAAGGIDDDPAAMALRARVKLSLGDAKGAAADWKRVVQQRPKQGEAWLGLVAALVEAGEHEEARSFLDNVSASPLSSTMVQNVRAEVRAHSGEVEAAKRDFVEATRRDPFDSRARVRLRELAATRR